jgi:hypothetical protein
MKGFIAKTVTLVGLGGCVAAGGGCNAYREVVDPCYPARYEYMARQETNEPFTTQVNNGHVLDQTVWNYHFEKKFEENPKTKVVTAIGTADLTPGGMDHLAYLARRRPHPDPIIYLQTAQDLPYDAEHPEQFIERRRQLDEARIVAIQNYLKAQTAGRDVAFQIAIHDPAEPGISAVPAARSVADMYNGSRGNLTLGGGGGGTTGSAIGATSVGGTGGSTGYR